MPSTLGLFDSNKFLVFFKIKMGQYIIEIVMQAYIDIKHVHSSHEFLY